MKYIVLFLLEIWLLVLGGMSVRDGEYVWACVSLGQAVGCAMVYVAEMICDQLRKR